MNSYDVENRKPKSVMNLRILGAFGVVLLAANLHGQRIDMLISANEPRGITSDGISTYVVCGRSNQIMKIDYQLKTSILAGNSKGQSGLKDGIGSQALFNDPQGIVYSALRGTNGALIVADYGNSAIRQIDINTRNVTTIGGLGSGVGGPDNADFVDGYANSNRFNYPAGVDIDTNSGTIYVADWGNGRIRTIDTNNKSATYVYLNTKSQGGVSRPTSVAVGNSNQLWVADNFNHVIWLVSNTISGITVTNVVGQFNNWGSDDADIGTQGRLNGPQGVLWRGWLANPDLIVADTGNNTLRRIFYNTNEDVQSYSLATFAGTGVAGTNDGLVAAATFSRPVGLSRVAGSQSFLITDSGGNSIRVYSVNTIPSVQTAAPKIGWLDFPIDLVTGRIYPRFNDITGAGAKTFYNDPLIVFMQSDDAKVYYTTGPTNLDNVAAPTKTSGRPKLFPSGATMAQVPSQGLQLLWPDVFVKAYADKDDGASRPSDTVHAEIRLEVAQPDVIGKNSAALVISCDTTNADIYYTLDGSTPDRNSTNSTKLTRNGADSVPLSITIEVDTTLTVMGFRDRDGDNYAPSSPTVVKLKASEYQGNQLVWGFASDEGSSQFIGAEGQNFYAPIALNMISGQAIYAFQFDSWIVRELSVPNPINIVFRSDLKRLEGTTPVKLSESDWFTNLNYLVVVTNSSSGAIERKLVAETNSFSESFSEMIRTVERVNTMAVRWGPLPTNLDDLVTYSMPHDILHKDADMVVMGSLGFGIPLGAADSVYQIQLDNFSGTDASGRPIPIQVVTTGTLSGGKSNLINSIKQVVVTNQSPKFLVGSALPFKWFNAGDFGSLTNIDAGDVIQTIYAAGMNKEVLVGRNKADPNVNMPVNCDMYYALDSWTPNANNWNDDPRTNSELLNAMDRGAYDTDRAVIDVADVYVTFRRSLDPSLNWFTRQWRQGELHTDLATNLLAKPTNIISAVSNIRRASPKVVSSGPHSLKIRGSDLQTSPGKTLLVPINAEILGDAPVRTLLLSIRVVALDGSPEITDPISYDEADTLVTASKASKFTLPRGPNIFSAAWLDNTVEGVLGTNPIGTLLIHLPSNATADSAYLVHFDKFSASPNGLAIFPSVVEDTLVTLSNRTGSSWNDGIPDAWRLRYFSTVSNDLSAASADADGDGFSNLQEYLAGTNPMDPFSKPQSQPPNRPTLGLVGVTNNPIPTFTMQWLSETGRSYFVETSQEAFGTNWMMISTNLPGSGAMTQFTDTNATDATRFYRVRAQ